MFICVSTHNLLYVQIIPIIHNTQNSNTMSNSNAENCPTFTVIFDSGKHILMKQ